VADTMKNRTSKTTNNDSLHTINLSVNYTSLPLAKTQTIC